MHSRNFGSAYFFVWLIPTKTIHLNSEPLVGTGVEKGMENGSQKIDVRDLMNRVEVQENRFLNRQFIAPVLRGRSVKVRIGGAICKIRVSPARYQGWGIFNPLSFTAAHLVREATLTERRDYLGLFQPVRMIICRKQGSTWFGSAANFGDSRIKIDGFAQLQLPRELQLFETVVVRFDGHQFWFEQHDSRSDPTTPRFLRDALNQNLDVGQLERSGLTAEQRAAYELNQWNPPKSDADATSRNVVSEIASDQIQARLRETLSHAGAQLVDYLERDDSCRVTYSVGTEHYTSSVNSSSLAVEVAGICLNGADHKFDLASLVGVLREGERAGEIYREY